MTENDFTDNFQGLHCHSHLKKYGNLYDANLKRHNAITDYLYACTYRYIG